MSSRRPSSIYRAADEQAPLFTMDDGGGVVTSFEIPAPVPSHSDQPSLMDVGDDSAPIVEARHTVTPISPNRGQSATGLLGPAPEAHHPVRFTPSSQSDLAPGAPRLRLRANLDALRVSAVCASESRTATADEQRVLAQYAGWGGDEVWKVFDEHDQTYARERAEIQGLVTPEAWKAMRASTTNANYTGAEVIHALWDVLAEAGFRGGRVLEPGCGTGNFIGFAPSNTRVTGVEIDPTSALIAQLLYPDADIRCESFGDTPIPEHTFDLVVGNVPYGDFPVSDDRYNPDNALSIHNHFIVKSLALTRPGGLVAVLTSSYTMDAASDQARRRIADYGDLVAATRLPSGALKASGGTDVVSDILVFRRRDDGEPVADESWLHAHPVALPVLGKGEPRSEEYGLNDWFLPDSPQGRVLGTMDLDVGMHGRIALQVHPVPDSPSGSFSEQLHESLATQLRTAASMGLSYGPHGGIDLAPAEDTRVDDLADGRVDGELVVDPTGQILVVRGHHTEPFVVRPKNATAEVVALVRMKDQVIGLHRMEKATGEDTPEIQSARTALKQAWATYTASYGPITRFTRTQIIQKRPIIDLEPGEGLPASARISTDVLDDARIAESLDAEAADDEQKTIIEKISYPPAVHLVTTRDPRGGLVAALEEWSEGMDAPRPAGILLARQLVPRTHVTAVESAEDGLAVVLDRDGYANLDGVAELTGLPLDQVVHDLADQVFEDPATPGSYVTRADYLSGNVRRKLATATEAAGKEPGRWDRHVEALAGVQPPDLMPGEIIPTLGASWIPVSDVQMFAWEMLGVSVHKRELKSSGIQVVKVAGTWTVTSQGDPAKGVGSTATWGTVDKRFSDILECLLNNKPVTVYRTQEYVKKDGSRGERNIQDGPASAAAQEKAEAIQERFRSWVWEDPDRRERLLHVYNDRFNATVGRSYAVEGAALTLPGLATGFTPYPHQREAVARIIHEPTVGLFHQVGAGKTAEMVMGSMELRRLNLVNKPCVVVPNHMLIQFQGEWLRLYPEARLLIADSEDTTKAARAAFVARAAHNDWDAVIITKSAFTKLSVTGGEMSAYWQRQVDAIDTFVDKAETKNERTVKAAEKMKARLKAGMSKRMKALENRQDEAVSGLCFEDTGIDMLVVDELHAYKGLTLLSDSGSTVGTLTASDLDMKLEYLRRTYGGKHVFVGATGTPVSNSISDLFVMQHFMRPDELENAGVGTYDEWVSTFAEFVTAPEVAPSGTSFQMKSRLARFVNIPELTAMVRQFGDIKTAEELHLPKPLLRVNPTTGRREPYAIVVEKDQELIDYMAALEHRLDVIHQGGVTPSEDNVLNVMTDARHAGLDMRLRGGVHGGLKVDAAADILATTYREHAQDVFLAGDGQPAPIPGALQVVFCDLGTPGGRQNENGESSVYDWLKDAAVRRGVPAEQVRFVHEATTPDQKENLFADCRDGHVSILIGSTDRMGMGTNIQDRLIHELHMDAPWKPAWLEQREGRILRPGNQNPEVQITNVIVKGSFDQVMWQTVERKARFINQVMNGTSERVAEDVGDVNDLAQYAGYLKAVAADNPLLIEQAMVRSTVAKLTALEKAHRINERTYTDRAAGLQTTITTARDQIEELSHALQTAVSTRGDAFTMTVGRYEGFKPHQVYNDWLKDTTQYLRCGTTVTDRTEAARLLRILLDDGQFSAMKPILRLGGQDLTIRTSSWAPRHRLGCTVTVGVFGTALSHQFIFGADTAPGTDLLGLIARLENYVNTFGDQRDRAEDTLAEAQKDWNLLAPMLDVPFQHAQELEHAQNRLVQIDKELAEQINQPPLNTDLPQADILEHTETPPGEAIRANSETPSQELGTELAETQELRRGHSFYPPADEWAHIPALYTTENTPTDETTVYLHYFVASCDWYITEVDHTTGEAFGWCDLGLGFPEWGYVDLADLEAMPPVKGLMLVERDCHFQPTPIAELHVLPEKHCDNLTIECEPRDAGNDLAI